MSHQDDVHNAADLRRVNADLARGLQRCSSVLRDYRSRLIAANSNDAFMICGEPGNDRGAARQDEDERTG